MANIKGLNISIETSKLNREENRLSTFNEWPHAFILPHILAKTGFYYIGPYDEVKCFFCNVIINSWELGDNEIDEHNRWSSRCPLLNEHSTSNVPKEPISDLNEMLSEFNGQKIDRRIGSYAETPIFSFKNNQQNYHFSDLALETLRLKTFVNWPDSTKKTPQELSEAGFFYTQKLDKVRCFSCGGGLCDWNGEDNPWELHAFYFDDCNYLKTIMGLKYIEMIKQKFSQIKK